MRVVVNEDATHYYRSPYAICMLLQIWLCQLFRRSSAREKLEARLAEHIQKEMLKYECSRYFTGKKYDVAVAYIQGYTADLAAYGIQADKKYIFWHSSTDEEHEFHERIFAQFDQIIAVSDYVKGIVRKLYPDYRDKVTVLENYVDASAIRAASGAFSVDRHGKRIVLCSCGRLSPVKGFDLAVEAARILKERNTDFLWYFVGDGPERKALEAQIAANDLQDHVIITGMQENPYPWMKACDIYVQPSREEAQPLTIIESKILCRPIVSTKTVGGISLVEDGTTGLLTDITGDAIADGVMRLAGSPDLYDRIGRNLEAIDYSGDFARYQQAWAALLEGEL